MVTVDGLPVTDASSVFEWAELVYEDMRPVLSYGAWKREVEGLIGRLLEPSEAVTLFDMADKGRRLGGE